MIHDPVKTIITNVHGTERVLKGAERKQTKVILASTSEVYGKSAHETFSEKDDLLIGPPTHCRWSYACSKLIDEFFAMAYFRASHLPIIVARFFNTVGPRQTGRYGMVVPRFVKSALSSENIRVYGDGQQSRCFCHVSDTVRALRLLADREEALGKVFNIGNVREISILGLAELVTKRLKSSSKIEFIPYEEAYEPGFEDMRRRMPDIGEIRKVTGWQPETDLEEIIDSVANYIKSH